jgi:hypothetical protein
MNYLRPMLSLVALFCYDQDQQGQGAFSGVHSDPVLVLGSLLSR